MRLLTLLVSVLALLQLGRLQHNDCCPDIEAIDGALGGITNRLNSLLKKMDAAKTQSDEESTSLMNAITSINDTLTDRLNSQLKKMDAAKTQSDEESTSLMNAITSINDTLTDRLNSQLRKMDAAKTQSDEESTSLMNAITSINDTLVCLKEDVNNLTTTQQQIGGAHNPAASCRDILEQDPDSTSKYYWIRDPSGRVTQQYCDMGTGGSENPAASCRDILELLPNSGSQLYWIRDSSGRVTQQYCDMEREGCGTRGGWMRVAHLDMTQPNQQCPSGFRLITSSSKRLCGRPGPHGGCVSVKFSTNGIAYNKVCGKVIAYQESTTDGTCVHANSPTIDEAYIDGVSITHGNPRQHIWSFVASINELSIAGSYFDPCRICPCSPGFRGPLPPFMGNNYFCESGTDIWMGTHLYPDNPLWDGEGCASSNSCCENNNPPWFCTELSMPTSNDIELRLCADETTDNEDVPIEKFELYVQ